MIDKFKLPLFVYEPVTFFFLVFEMNQVEVGVGAWILAGGTHHSAFSYDITEEYWEDFAEMLGIEYVKINKDTKSYEFKQQLQNNEMYYMLNKALR